MNRHLTALHQRQAKQQAAREASPVGQANARAQALLMIQRIKRDANIHALIGQDAPAAIQASARILFIALGAAISMGSSGDEPDLRIIRGAASAAGDVAANAALLEANRQAIISGLNAADRLWPALHPRDLIHSYIKLEQMLSSTRGLNLSDFESKK